MATEGIDLAAMSRDEKLRLMEALWADLGGEDFKSPAWHEAELVATDARLRAGQERVVDWPEAKRELHNC